MLEKFRPIKVLYVCPNSYLGGAERVVLNFCLSHKFKDEIEAAILFFKPGEMLNLAHENEINFFKLSKSFRFRNPISLLRSLIEIRKILKNFSPDILHSSMAYSHLACFFPSLGLGIKRVWFQHGPVGSFTDKLASMFSVDLMLFNSNYTLHQHILTSFPNSKKGHKIIPLGVKIAEIDRNDIDKMKAEINPNNTQYIFLVIGRISPFKGIHVIIEALNLLPINIRRKIKVLIIGSSNLIPEIEYEEKLKKNIRDYKLQFNLEFIGAKKNINLYLKASDALIQSSIAPEAFGMSVAEAMALGVLVIGSNLGGTKDILLDNETGIVFNPLGINGPRSLASVLKNVIQLWDSGSFEKTKKLSLNGKNFIEKKYTFENMNNALVQSYRSIL